MTLLILVIILYKLDVGSSTPLNNFNSAPVTSFVQSPSILSITNFTSGSGLSVLPFTKSYKMTPNPSGDGGGSD